MIEGSISTWHRWFHFPSLGKVLKVILRSLLCSWALRDLAYNNLECGLVFFGSFERTAVVYTMAKSTALAVLLEFPTTTITMMVVENPPGRLGGKEAVKSVS